MIDREKISRLLGLLCLVLLFIGGMLYTINYSNPALIQGFAIAGAVCLAGFCLLNLSSIALLLRKRSSRYGANMLVMIVLFVCILVIIQAISSRHSRRFDLTSNQRFSLSEQTVNLLGSLTKDVEVFAFYKRGTAEEAYARDLIGQYTHRSDRIRLQFIDPDQKPAETKEMGVTLYSTTVVRYDQKKDFVLALSEESLTNAILKVVRDEVKSLYVITGHQEKRLDYKEREGLSIFKEAVETGNYSLANLSLLQEPGVPNDCYLLLIAGPRTDYFESEIEKIQTYLARGGNALFLIDPQLDLPNLISLIAGYNIHLENTMIIDPVKNISDSRVPVVEQYERHPITRNFDIATFYPLARSLRIVQDPARPEVKAQYLAATGKRSWGEMDLERVSRGQAEMSEGDIMGPVPMAAVAARDIYSPDSVTAAPGEPSQTKSKIVVFGDSDFATNSYFRISGNADLLLNTISYLAEDEDLIAIRPKQGLGDRLFLTPSQGRLIFLVCLVLLPLIVISLGVTLYLKRRKCG